MFGLKRYNIRFNLIASRYCTHCTEIEHQGSGPMELTVTTILIAFAGVFLICFMKGAFGGGLLVPGLVIGIGVGYLLFRVLDHRAVAIVMAIITLIFVGLWFFGGSEAVIRPRSSPKAVAAGLASGVWTMVAHSGGPPLGMY